MGVNKSLSIFYNADLEIDYSNLERIIQAIVTLADSVVINSMVEPARRLSHEERKDIENKIQTLISEKAICLWDYPFSRRSPNIETSKSDIIYLEEKDYLELYDNINDVLKNNPKRGSIFRYVDNLRKSLDNRNIGIESTSKIIEYRNEHFNIGIASILEVNYIMNPPHKDAIFYSEFYRYSEHEKIVKQLFSKKLNLPPLAHFNIEDILKIRKKNKSFKKELLKETSKIPFYTNKVIEKKADDLYNKYVKSLERIAEDVNSFSHLVPLSLRNLLYTLAGFIYPLLSQIFSFSDPFLTWLYQRKEIGFPIFIIELRKASRKIRN